MAVTSILDTTILVDVLRNHTPAVQWLAAQQQPTLGITPLVWMELITGAPNKTAQRQAASLLTHFELVYLEHADFDWAMQQLLAHGLSHNVGMIDCLIASVSFRLQVPLYTRNLKHFKPMLADMAQSPY